MKARATYHKFLTEALMIRRARTMSKPKKPAKKPIKTSVQEEVTHLGVITNLMLAMDSDAQGRITSYLVDRFG